VAVISRVNEDGTLRSNNEVIGLQASDYDKDWDEHVEWLRSAGFHVRIIKIDTNQPGKGTRAEHALSGRIE
jgi:hypothetical protein